MAVSNMLSISLNKLTQLERSMNTNVDYIVFHDQFKGNASTNFLRSTFHMNTFKVFHSI